MAGIAEEKGVLIATETPAQTPLLENGKLLGVRTGDKGVNKAGERKGTFMMGADALAKATVLCEGRAARNDHEAARVRARLTRNSDPQNYATGVKEGSAGRPGEEGRGHPTMNWPLKADTFGGGFIYGLSDTLWAVGFATGLDASDPTNDPHANLQRFKTHPLVRKLLEGGKPIAYGAKAIPEGGWYAMPKLSADGLLLAGDAGGFLNGGRLRASTSRSVGHARRRRRCLRPQGERLLRREARDYETRVAQSWAAEELKSMRNFHRAFDGRLWQALPRTGLPDVHGRP